jgi:hypothetical protein
MKKDGHLHRIKMDWDELCYEISRYIKIRLICLWTHTKICPTCDGTGEHYHEIDEMGYLCCDTCDGEGKINPERK